MKWLYHILQDGTLKDNQTYFIADNKFRYKHLKYELNQRQPRQQKKCWNDNEKIWHFLEYVNNEINRLIQDSTSKNLILFNNKEYEHNTNDNLIDLKGSSIHHFTLNTTNVIGYVKRGDYSLKVSSRFGDNFLKAIIASADGFLEIENVGGISEKTDYEWLLLYLWKTKLKKAIRLGLPKKYVNKSNQLNKIKGQIDPVAYQLSNNGKYLCRYREHSYNNQAIRLIAQVFKLKKGNEFLSDIQTIKNTFVTAIEGQRDSLRSLLQTPHFTNPFFGEYNEVIDLSKLIIKQQNVSLAGKQDNSSFFFDVSMLFEYFIRKTLINAGFRVASKPNHKLTIPTGVEPYKRKLEPDLVIETDNGNLIFDVKYKWFDTKYGVKREDLFQLHTYVGQYGNAANITGCGFIYPLKTSKKGTKELVTAQPLKIMGKETTFYVVFIEIPEDAEENYNANFRENCNRFIQNFKQIAQYERTWQNI